MFQRFLDPKTHLVHDPNGSLRTGDVVAITPGWRTSKKVRHVVKYIIAPAFVPADERPPVPTVEERFADRIARKDAKDERKRARDDLERMERVVARGSKLAHLAEWELARMHRILAARDPARRTTAQMERIDVRSKEILRRGSKIVSQAEWAIGNSVLSRETV